MSDETRRSGPRCRETRGPPVPLHGALDSVWSPRGASRGSEPGTREVRFHVSVRVADVGRKHRALGPPLESARFQGDPGASQEEARSAADGARGWREGESVHGRNARPPKVVVTSTGGPSGLRGYRHDGRRSRVLARLARKGGVMRSPRLAGQSTAALRRKAWTADSASVDTEVGRACLRVTTERQRVWVRGGEGSSRSARSEGSPHPRC